MKSLHSSPLILSTLFPQDLRQQESQAFAGTSDTAQPDQRPIHQRQAVDRNSDMRKLCPFRPLAVLVVNFRAPKNLRGLSNGAISDTARGVRLRPNKPKA
jgi:hypothetical protein